MTRKIGITTTVPVEAIYAIGAIPVDLNNRFINHPAPEKLLDFAQRDGFAQGVCAWIQGIYAAALQDKISEVVAVVHGDCANTIALGQVLALRGLSVIEFAFPLRREPLPLARAIDDFTKQLGALPKDVAAQKTRLDAIRKKLERIDEMTWRTGQITGGENHRYLVGSSDFNGDPDSFEKKIDRAIEQAKTRPPRQEKRLRIGILGVPTAFSDLYETLDGLGAHVVFNEVQRQFSMPGATANLTDQYLNYTYPFDLDFRIADIDREIKRRKIDGLVHYIQSFCHRQIEDIVLREKIDVPILSIEGDRPGPVDGRTRTRIDAFLEMLHGH
jgi:benzoyl-CoA reductase/2-hydroxyglutaryl-CoA dehydratase subunit BcrC/BadD/HgdB